MKVKKIVAIATDIERICNLLSGQLTGGADREKVVLSSQDAVKVSAYLAEYRDQLLAREVPEYNPWEG